MNLSAAAGQTAEVMVQHGAVEALMTVASNQIENRDPNTIENHQVLFSVFVRQLYCMCDSVPGKDQRRALCDLGALTYSGAGCHLASCRFHAVKLTHCALRQLYAIKALKNLSCEPAVAPVLRSKGAQDWLESMEREKPEVMAQLDGALAAMTLAESS